MSFEVGLQEVPYCLEFEQSDLMNGVDFPSYYSSKARDLPTADSCMFNDDPVAKLRAENLNYISQYIDGNKGPSPLLGSQSNLANMRQPSSQYSSESNMSMMQRHQPSTQYSSQYPYSSVIVSSLQQSHSPASSFSNSPAHSPQRLDDFSHSPLQMGQQQQQQHRQQLQQQQQQQQQGRMQQPLAAFGLSSGMSASGSCENLYFDPNNRRRKQDYELTAAEYEKRRLRRERNKLAALRCRTRRRERIDALEMETAEIEGNNASVESEIHGLQSQVEELQKILRDHDCRRQLESLSERECSRHIDLTDSHQSKSDKIKRESSTSATLKDGLFSLK